MSNVTYTDFCKQTGRETPDLPFITLKHIKFFTFPNDLFGSQTIKGTLGTRSILLTCKKGSMKGFKEYAPLFDFPLTTAKQVLGFSEDDSPTDTELKLRRLDFFKTEMWHQLLSQITVTHIVFGYDHVRRLLNDNDDFAKHFLAMARVPSSVAKSRKVFTSEEESRLFYGKSHQDVYVVSVKTLFEGPFSQPLLSILQSYPVPEVPYEGRF